MLPLLGLRNELELERNWFGNEFEVRLSQNRHKLQPTVCFRIQSPVPLRIAWGAGDASGEMVVPVACVSL